MDIHAAARRFGVDGSAEIVSVSGGHINDTYLVCGRHGRYVLQRLNTDVFSKPETVMRNIAALCAQYECVRGTQTALPHFLTADGANFVSENGFWRMYEYVEEQPDREMMYKRAGRAFGDIMRIMSGIGLEDTGLRLHDFGGYLASLSAYGVLDANDSRLLNDLADDISRIFHSGLPVRNIHGDAKLANIVFGERCTVLDLDTLSRGWAALDIGDLIRSACPEFPDIPTIAELASGCAEGLGGLLTDEEVRSLSWGVLYVTGELAMRYYIDWVSENGYFKGKTPLQCKARADELMAQLRRFIAQRENIEAAVLRGFGKYAKNRDLID